MGLLCLGSPPVLVLTSTGAGERAFVDSVQFRLTEAVVSETPRPQSFLTRTVTDQAASQAGFFERAPTGLLVWTGAPTPTVYVLTSGAAQPRLRVIEAVNWSEAGTAFVALWEETADRFRRGVGPAATAPRWRASAESGGFVALAGGGDLSGYVAVRGIAARRWDSGLHVGAGIEGWPTLFGATGWGIGPVVVVGAVLPFATEIDVSLMTAVVVHRWSAPEGFRDPEPRVSVRLGPRVAVRLPVGDRWTVGARAELGWWPVRSVFETGETEVSGIPSVDLGGVLIVDHVF